MLEKLKIAEREIAQFKSKEALGQIDQLLTKVKTSGGVRHLVAKVNGELNNEQLRALAASIVQNFSSEAIVIVLFSEGVKPVVVASVSEGARSKGVHAGELVKRASKVLGGGGGGKDDFAQGGGVKISEINKVFEESKRAIAALS